MIQKIDIGGSTTYFITNEGTVSAKDLDSDGKADDKLDPFLSDSTDLTDLDSDAKDDDDLELLIDVANRDGTLDPSAIFDEPSLINFTNLTDFDSDAEDDDDLKLYELLLTEIELSMPPAIFDKKVPMPHECDGDVLRFHFTSSANQENQDVFMNWPRSMYTWLQK